MRSFYRFKAAQYKTHIPLRNLFILSLLALCGFAQAQQASNITFQPVPTTATSLVINWSNGGGVGRIVVVKSSKGRFTPTDNADILSLNASPAYANAAANDQDATAEVAAVVFAGTGTGPVTVTGLTSGSQYYVQVYEFGDATSSPDYDLTTSTSNPKGFAIYSSSGSFTVPIDVTDVTVQAWGGGGGGGGANGTPTATTERGGGGGSGGSYTLANPTVTGGAVITVTVGSGGGGGSGAEGSITNGGTGGTTTFASSVSVDAIGGAGGVSGQTGADTGAGGGTTTGVTLNGGAGVDSPGTDPDATSGGGGGGGAGVTGAGSSATGPVGGVGGTGGGGSGGNGRTATTGAGTAATQMGGGGGGAYTRGDGGDNDVNGGAGAGGYMIVSFNDNTAPTATIARLTPAGQNITAATTSVTFRVTFNESVLNVNSADFSLGTTNTAAGTVGTVTPFGSESKVFDVQITGITGSGDLDLNFGAQDIVDVSNNAFGGTTAGDQIYTRDDVAPSVVSIVPAQSPSRTRIPKTGTITASTASTAVTGVGTAFTTELFIGAVLWNAAGTQSVGIVQSITDDTNLTLTGNANNSFTDSYSIRFYFTVTFSEPINVSTITTADFVKGTGTATGTNIVAVGPVSTLPGPPITGDTQSTSFNVSVDATGNGTWRLDKTTDAYQDVFGNSSTNAFTTGTPATIDNTAPTVTSIVRKTPTAAYTQATSVTYTVTFAEDVTGVDLTDFTATVTGVTAGAITVNPVSATVYDVDVASISASNGTLRLDVNANASIVDLAGNTFGSTAYTGGQIYTFDYSNPAQPATYNAVTIGGNVVANYWNSHNTTVRLTVAIPSNGTDPSLLGGTVEVQARIASGTFATISSTSSLTITGGDQGNNKDIDIDAAAITAITGYAQGEQLQFQVRFVDLVGNTGTYRQSTNSLTVDTVKPSVSGTPTFALNANGRETIVLNFTETLALTNGVLPVRTATNGNPGFYSNQPFIRNNAAQTFYTSVGNTITLSSDADAQWDNTIQITYTANPGVAGNYVRDAAGNEMATVTFGVTTPAPLISSSMVLNLNGAAAEIITFAVDQTLNTPTTAGAVTGITVDPDGAGPTAAGVIAGTYSTTGNTITIQAAADGQWSTATTVSYSGGNLAGATAVPMAAFGPEPILLAVSITTGDPTNGTWAKQGETITLNITRAASATLLAAPTGTIGGLVATPAGAGPAYTLTITTDGTVPQNNVLFTINALQTGRSTDVTLTTDGSVANYDNILPSPNPPSAPGLDAGSDNGFSNSDDITGINSGLVFSGVAGSVENNATVLVYDNVTLLGTTTAAGDGSWSYTHVAALADGPHPINIVARDPAYNVTSASANLDITIDTSVPSVSSVNRATATNLWSTTNGTSAASVDFTVTFSDVIDVSTLTAADFSIPVTGSLAGATITGILPITNSNTYTVTVGGYTGLGTLGLNYVDNNDATEAYNIVNLPTGSGFTGQTYTIVLPEPNNQAITVSAPTVTSNSITVQWNGTNVAQVPTHYLVLAVESGDPFPTLEEADQSAHYEIIDGTLVKNVVRSGGGTHSVAFTGLPSGTTYDFRVYKYTKSTDYTIDNIDYEMTSPGVLNNVTTTTASLSTVVLNSTAAPISSLKDNTPTTERASVMQFTIYDDGLDPLVPNVMTFQPNGLGPETITMTLRGEITLAEGAAVTGFTNSAGTPLTAIYTGKNSTNTITLTNGGANGTWTTGTTISYNATTGNVQFVNAAMGRMQPIVAHAVNAVADVVVDITTPGLNSFQVPAGVTQLTIEVWGAGGSGGPVVNNASYGGASSGGGGGGYSRRTISVTPLTNFSYFVGSGGPAALGTTTYVQAGNDGQDSYFGPSLVLAKGGQGGWNNDWTDYYGTTIHSNTPTRHGLGGDATLGVGDVRYYGGNGGYGYDGGVIPGSNPGVFGSGGGGGSSAGNAANGNNGGNGGATCNGCGVVGGSAPTGGGSGGIGWNGLAGNPGSFPGGGGGGTSQYGPFPSGAGANGRIVITYAGAHPAVAGTSDWSADNAPFRFNQLVVTPGDAISPSLATDWSTVIAGVELQDDATPANSINSVDNPGNVTINPTNITFSGLNSDNAGELGFIPDANGSTSSKTYTLKVWLKDDLGGALASSIDGLFLDFKVLPALQTSLTNDDDNNLRSSRIVTGHPEIESGASEITVDATKLVFNAPGNPAGPLATQPQASIGVGVPFSSSTAADPEVYALDANNNLDLDYNKSGISVTNTLGYLQSTNAMNFSNGMLSLNPLYFTTGSATTVNTLIEVTDPALPLATRTATSTGVWPRISSLTTITEGPTAPASELASFTSITNTTPAGFNFDFNVVDDNGADPNAYLDNDALPTLIQNITITQGTNNGDNGGGADATTFDDWTKSLLGARLSAIGNTQFVDIAVGSGITANQLSFSIPAGSFMETVPDNGSRTYQLRLWLRTQIDTVTGVGLQNILDNKDYSFAIDISNITLNSSSPNATSTKFASGSASSADGRNQVRVTATKLKFITHPASAQNYDSPITPTPVVKAVDANGNVDLGYTGTPALSTLPNGARTYPFLAGTDGLVNTNGLISFDNTGPDVLTITSLGGGFNNDNTRMVVSGGTNDLGAPVTAAQSNAFILNYSGNSDVLRETTFTYPTNILYATAANQEPTNLGTTTGTVLDRYTIRDGGGAADADGTATTLSSITFRVTNWQYIRRIALYNVGETGTISSPGTEIAGSEIDVMNAVSPTITNITGNTPGSTADITFSGLTGFSAPDNGTRSRIFEIRASFIGNGIVDNEDISFQIMQITAAGVSSSFANPTPTTVTTKTPLGTNENQIEVVATQLDFLYPPDNFFVSINQFFSPNVAARDIYQNTDEDFTSAITDLTNVSGHTMSSTPAVVGQSFAAGTYTFPSDFQFTSGDNQDDVSLDITAGGISSVDRSPGPSPYTPLITLQTSYESSISVDPTFDFSAANQTNIPYHLHVEDTYPLTDADSSFVLARVLLVDGSRNGYTYTSGFGTGTQTTPLTPLGLPANIDGLQNQDQDGAPTRLDSLVLRVFNPSNIKRIALMDSTGNSIGVQINVNEAKTVQYKDFKFGATPLTTAYDDNSTEIKVRVAFWNDSTHVTDNQIIHVSVLRAQAGDGSKFYPEAPDATYVGGVRGGTVAGSNVGLTAPLTTNRIEVKATSLDFVDQPSPVAGKREPITGEPGTSPGGSTGLVHARDRHAVLDLDFNFAATITTPAGLSTGPILPSAFPNLLAFNNGELDLTGMRYDTTGIGTLRVTAVDDLGETRDSDDPDDNTRNKSIPSDQVDVIHVSAVHRTDNDVIPDGENLRGGEVDKVIFGVEIYADHKITGSPLLNEFAIVFRDDTGAPYDYGTVFVPSEVKLLRAVGNAGANPLQLASDYTIIETQSAEGVLANVTDKLIFRFSGTSSGPLPLDLIQGSATVKFYLEVDVDVDVSVGTLPIRPYVVDLGYNFENHSRWKLTNGNINTDIGSSAAYVEGFQRSFASTKEPALVSSYPPSGKLNVPLGLDSVVLDFDVDVVSFDGKINVVNSKTGVATVFQAKPGKGWYDPNSILPLDEQVADTLVFFPPVGFTLDPDTVYYITVDKGVYSFIDNTGKGIADEGFNLFGGIEFSNELYFKGSSEIAPKLVKTVASAYGYTPSAVTINFGFDKPGKVNYMVVTAAGAPATVTNAQILGTSAYLNSTVIERGSAVIDQYVDNLLYVTIRKQLTAGAQYYVYAFAENDKEPTPIATPSPYGAYDGTAQQHPVGANGPTTSFRMPATIPALFAPSMSMCPESSVKMEEPIILSEPVGLQGYFSSVSPLQTFYILLPTGFQFDVSKTPTVLFNGVDTVTNAALNDFKPLPTSPGNPSPWKYINSGLLQIQFVNSGSLTLDQIVISDLYLVAQPNSGGDVLTFASNSTIPNNNKIASLSTQNARKITFTNSYDVENNPWPYDEIAGATPYKPVSYIPDSYASVKLIPQPPIVDTVYQLTNDFGLSLFSGDGVIGDVLTTSAVAKNATFKIFLNHTDQNGCNSVQEVQYLVYEDSTAIAELLKPQVNEYRMRGTKVGLIPGPVSVNNVPGLPNYTRNDADSVSWIGTAGYRLIQLYADIPERAQGVNSILTYTQDTIGWQKIVRQNIVKQPTNALGINNPGEGEHTFANLGRTFRTFNWEYSDLIRKPVLETEGLTYPYDSLSSPFVKTTPQGRTYFDVNSSLGVIEFTGLYQSTADYGVFVPFRQEVEIFIPSIPVIEVTGESARERWDGSNADLNYKPIYCENGATFNLTGYPLAASSDVTGYFVLKDSANAVITPGTITSATNSDQLTGIATDFTIHMADDTIFYESGKILGIVESIQSATQLTLKANATATLSGSPYNVDLLQNEETDTKGFIDNGNGTATFNPRIARLKNQYRTIRVEYTYKQNASPTFGTGVLYIRVTPNPVASFKFLSDTVNVQPLSVGRPIQPLSYCEDNWIVFDNTTNFVDPENPTNYAMTDPKWSFGVANSSRNTQNGVNPILNRQLRVDSSYRADQWKFIFNEQTQQNEWSLQNQTLPDSLYFRYPSFGTYLATFQVSSGYNCVSQEITQPVHVGVIPSPGFEMFGLNDITVNELATNGGTNYSTISSGLSYPRSNLLAGEWYYGDALIYQTDPDTANGTVFSLVKNHTYANPGHYKVTLLQRTNITQTSLSTTNNPGCERIYQRDVIIVPAAPVLPAGQPFIATFDGASVEQWQIDDGKIDPNTTNPAQQSSWTFGDYFASGFSPTALPNNSGGPVGWFTNSYLPKERSYLFTSTYNFSQMSRPMLSFDQYTQTLANDGTALDFSIDSLNVADPAKVWYRLGKQGEGLFWYNQSNLAGKPGAQSEYPSTTPGFDYGWTGNISSLDDYDIKNDGWVNSRHNITPSIPTDKPIAFRFAFAANSDAGDPLAKGIAIDNFYFGERTRVVVVENFTTAAKPDAQGFEKEDAEELQKDFNNAVEEGIDYVKLNYHVGFPAQDPFNLSNPADPSARALYYGVSQTPSARMDGIDYTNSGQLRYQDYGQARFDVRTLDPAGVNITFDSAHMVNGSARVMVTVRANKSIPASTYLHVVLADTGLINLPGQPSNQTDFEYVVRKMLPSASGRKFAAALNMGQSETFSTVSWIPDNLQAPANDMVAIVFVQDEITKVIHQAAMASIPDPASLVTGLENPFTLKDIKIYPNPADDQLNIVFPNALEVDVPMMMFDPVGRVTHNSIATKGTQSVTIDTRGNAQGVYILQMNLGEGNLVRAKVIISHKE